jgi:hypothetical protein
MDTIAVAATTTPTTSDVLIHGESSSSSILRYMNLMPSQSSIDQVLHDMKRGPKRLTHVRMYFIIRPVPFSFPMPRTNVSMYCIHGYRPCMIICTGSNGSHLQVICRQSMVTNLRMHIYHRHVIFLIIRYRITSTIIFQCCY